MRSISILAIIVNVSSIHVPNPNLSKAPSASIFQSLRSPKVQSQNSHSQSASHRDSKRNNFISHFSGYRAKPIIGSQRHLVQSAGLYQAISPSEHSKTTDALRNYARAGNAANSPYSNSPIAPTEVNRNSQNGQNGQNINQVKDALKILNDNIKKMNTEFQAFNTKSLSSEKKLLDTDKLARFAAKKVLALDEKQNGFDESLIQMRELLQKIVVLVGNI